MGTVPARRNAAHAAVVDGWSPSLVRHLLELHFNRQHHAFCITYRPAFMRDMASGGPYFSKLLLNAVRFRVSREAAAYKFLDPLRR